MSEIDDELAELLDSAVTRLSALRQTFTEEEALLPIWDQGYEITPQGDPQERFVLAYEANGKHPRQWRLSTQTLANDRLLDALRTGVWSGQDLDAELATLGAEDHVHYVFCPYDSRFTTLPDGTLEPADRECNVVLEPAIRATLDALRPELLEQWHNEGAGPLTVRQITERLDGLGWSEASGSNSWLLMRAWLLEEPQVARVGQDYWIPADALPKEPGRTRLQVLPVGTMPAEETSEFDVTRGGTLDTQGQESLPILNKDRPVQGRALITHSVSWTLALRTIHLLEGFVPVPPGARSLYPPRSIGEGDRQVVRGLWYEDDESLWLWLDRTQDRLYGPDLARKLEWREAGDLLHIEWRPEVIILRLAGHDDEVQREEGRLVDPQALKALRGGLGEAYRQSIQSILWKHIEGLTFDQLVKALRERQGHDVHRGTVRALLYASGFVHRDGHWFAAPQAEVSARKLRAVLIETLLPTKELEQTAAAGPLRNTERLHRRVQLIRTRLSELVSVLHDGAPAGGKSADSL